MHAQAELGLSHAPEVSADDIHLVEQILGLEGDWMTAKEIAGRVVGKHFDERRVRQIASRSEGRILSYPGSPGYRLTRQSTKDEIEAAHRLVHQANEMRRRYIEITGVFYARRPA